MRERRERRVEVPAVLRLHVLADEGFASLSDHEKTPDSNVLSLGARICPLHETLGATPALTARKMNIRPTGDSPVSTYSVRSGDTLSALAQRFNTTVDALAKANHISNPNMIRVGQRL